MGAAVQIRVYDNKLSIWYEGALPQGLDIASLKADHNSRPRNPKIADACFKSGYIDTWGRGTLKIINSCKEAVLPEPLIVEKDGGVEVTIYKDIVGGQDSNAIGSVIDNLTDRQKEILQLIIVNPRVSRKELSEKSGINESAIQKHTDALKKKKTIERDSKTTGQWTILIAT
jgi:ATP-dependent DNA helicase RecG